MILHWNGNDWNQVSNPTTTYLWSVDMTSAVDGWAVGESGRILRYRDTAPVTATPTPTSFPTPTPTPAPFFAWQGEAEGGVLTAPMTTGDDPTASACTFVYDVTSWSNGAATYAVYVPYGGTHHLWARVMGLDWNHNSFFVSVDGSPDAIFEVLPPSNQWTWGWQRVTVDAQSGTAVNLGAGAHMIEFKRREPDTRLDVVALTNDASYAPAAITVCGSHEES